MEAFYRKQTVLLTGATGFIGKVILFQLLRMRAGKIYLLIRKKKDRNAQERIEDLFGNFLFTSAVLKQKRSVQPIEGDITAPLLGLKPHDLTVLRNEVTIVIHSATSTRFDHSISAAVRRNVLSTFDVLRLCDVLGALRCFVYVSTAYSGCDRRFIEERITTPDSKKARDLLDLLETDPTELDACGLNGHQNPFTFSKFHAESLVHYSGLPHAIVRPPIIVGSIRDPARGWVDNFNDFHGVVAQADLGYDIPIVLDPVSQISLIPVDMAANIVIGAGWRCAERHRSSGLVYNCVDTCTTLLAKEMTTRTIAALEARSEKPVCYRPLSITTSRLWRFLVLVLFFYVPAILTDMWACLKTNADCAGAPSSDALIRTRKAHRRATVLDNFPSSDYIYEYENVRTLSNHLSPREYKKYPMDVSYIDWDTFMPDIALGIARYVQTYKEDEEAE